MAIYAPGKRDKHNRKLSKGKRSLVAMLSLTAMVDMFTVLAVFLLQNYKVDEIQLKQTVDLPMATRTKKLEPANVVVIKKDMIMVNDKEVAKFDKVKEQTDWLIEPLKLELEKSIKEKKLESESGLQQKLKKAISKNEEKDIDPGDPGEKYAWGRVTLQADKEVDFLTVKKVMYTITESGASMINFAVTPRPEIKNQ